MRKLFFGLLSFIFLATFPVNILAASKVSPTITVTPQITATPSAVVVEKEEDLTVPTENKGKLDKMLEEQKVEGWFGFNVLKLAIREAVKGGVSPNTIVVLFLFPLVAGLVAFSRQVVGVSGFGIITPAILSVAFLSTGGVAGLVLLTFIMTAATLSRMAMKRVKVPYLPKLSMLIWLLSLEVMGLLLLSPHLGLSKLMGVGIFPILLFVLLAESFIEAQITRSFQTSLFMTLETVILALIAYKVMSAQFVQSQVLLHPEVSVVMILAFDYAVGRYKGLRLLEIWRFRKMLKK